MIRSITPKGECYIVGDIHGNFTKVANCLDSLGFNPKEDTLVCVGDLVDRGAESSSVLEFLAYPFVHSVQGNHETFALSWYKLDGYYAVLGRDYIRWGGEWFMKLSPGQQGKIARRLHKLPIAIEINTPRGVVGVVHANIPARTSWAEVKHKLRTGSQSMIDWLQWDREIYKREVTETIPDLAALVVGHTPVLRPMTYGNRHYIDTHSRREAGFFSFYRVSDGAIITADDITLANRHEAGIYKTMSQLWEPPTGRIA